MPPAKYRLDATSKNLDEDDDNDTCAFIPSSYDDEYVRQPIQVTDVVSRNLSGSRKFDTQTTIIDVQDFDKIKTYIEKIKPDFIINCIGILINESKKNIKKSIYLNALFPHLLDDLSFKLNFKLIHISTDCVYSGKKGESYIETDQKDGLGNYSITKGLGEIINDKNLTLRTSVIGPELKPNGEELFNWFMLQEKPINGYTNVFWSGISTLELAKAVLWAIENNITGLYNLTNGKKISKNDLLLIINKYSSKKLIINPVETLSSDKSFHDTRKEINYDIPSYNIMVKKIIQHITVNSVLYPHYKIK